jgi:5'-3' exonuclease
MNGIIHNCSLPNDSDAHFRLSEEKIFLAIFNYIDHLFMKIKPQKVFFMALDGMVDPMMKVPMGFRRSHGYFEPQYHGLTWCLLSL